MMLGLEIGFNPCSYGSFVLTMKLFKITWGTGTVSILVLMDLSFLQVRKMTDFMMVVGFNPCSYGSFVLTNLTLIQCQNQL